VISDAESNSEAKSFCQPIGRRAGVRVNKHRNYGARRHRSVESHPETLSLQRVGEYCAVPGATVVVEPPVGQQCRWWRGHPEA
jgi:hypothetical protein